MTYTPRKKELVARLRDARELEAAMRAADLNAVELARASGVSKSYINYMRAGTAGYVSRTKARALERALDQERGALFTYGTNGSEP